MRPSESQPWNLDEIPAGDRSPGLASGIVWSVAVLVLLGTLAASGITSGQETAAPPVPATDSPPKTNAEKLPAPADADPAADNTRSEQKAPSAENRPDENGPLDLVPLAKPLPRELRRSRRFEPEPLPAGERLAQRVLEVFTYSWFVFLGAAVGSFLNVVIYRWPAGLSLLHPPSRCGSCLAPILIQHNLPIIGWINLRGRCYACDAWISVRYPLIEATIAVLFVALAAIEFTSGGSNLPGRSPDAYSGVLWTVWNLKRDLLGLFLYHINLLTGLVAAAMIAWDGHRLPVKLLVYLALTTVIPGVLVADLHPVPMCAAEGAVFGWSMWPAWLHPVGSTAAGLIAGLAIGAVVWVVSFGGRKIEDRAVTVDLTLLSGIVGAAVGWQAALSFLGLGAMLTAGGAVLARACGCCELVRGRGLIVATAAVVQILAWLPLTRVPGNLQPESAVISAGPIVLLAVVCAGVARTITGARRADPLLTLPVVASEPPGDMAVEDRPAGE